MLYPGCSQVSSLCRRKKYFRKRNIKSVLSIPFIVEDKLLGILALNSIARKHEFTESEIKLCQAIGNQLAMAVENAQLIELSQKHSRELEKLSLRIINAQEQERKNIAGKLHDVIAQDLTALRFDLKMSQQELPEKHAYISQRLKKAEDLATWSLENLRNLTSDLRPPILDDFGLASALRWYVDGFSRRSSLKIDLEMPEVDRKFPPEFETSIYRIVQEGLSNVAKHSGASRVNIAIRRENSHMRILIRDNGSGFDTGSLLPSSGFGLLRLKEMTELLGGKFKIISKKGRGVRLDMALPWPSKEKT